MKSNRHLKILELVKKYNIETQDSLVGLLNEAGFDVTQATISRDIKQLRLTKSATSDGRYIYAVSEPEDNEKPSNKALDILHDTVISMDLAQNILVIKTYSGMAQGAAAALDSMNYKEIVGSIAGDDTIMIVFHNNAESEAFLEKLTRETSQRI